MTQEKVVLIQPPIKHHRNIFWIFGKAGKFGRKKFANKFSSYQKNEFSQAVWKLLLEFVPWLRGTNKFKQIGVCTRIFAPNGRFLWHFEV